MSQRYIDKRVAELTGKPRVPPDVLLSRLVPGKELARKAYGAMLREIDAKTKAATQAAYKLWDRQAQHQAALAEIALQREADRQQAWDTYCSALSHATPEAKPEAD